MLDLMCAMLIQAINFRHFCYNIQEIFHSHRKTAHFYFTPFLQKRAHENTKNVHYRKQYK